MAKNSRAVLTVILALAAAPALAQVPSGGGDSAGSATSKVAAPVTGEQVYTQVCQACHMADAKGGSGAANIPALASNPRLSVAGYPITMILKGRGAMPSLTDMLSPAQIANVTGYIRTHFGNSYPAPVTAEEVARLSAPKSAP
jgi:mono/diheme cytochrome c family protein